MTESDGVAEVIEDAIRLAGSAAINARTAAAHRRELLARQANARQQHELERLNARADADRAAALSELAVVGQGDWWDAATKEQIEHAWETAQRWREREPAANRAAVTLRAEHLRRGGVDLEAASDAERRQLREITAASFPQPAAQMTGRSPRHANPRPAHRVHTPSLEHERER